eukprot:8657283-Lingulodinium_polyedra.AAC.1
MACCSGRVDVCMCRMDLGGFGPDSTQAATKQHSRSTKDALQKHPRSTQAVPKQRPSSSSV